MSIDNGSTRMNDLQYRLWYKYQPDDLHFIATRHIEDGKDTYRVIREITPGHMDATRYLNIRFFANDTNLTIEIFTGDLGIDADTEAYLRRIGM